MAEENIKYPIVYIVYNNGKEYEHMRFDSWKEFIEFKNTDDYKKEIGDRKIKLYTVSKNHMEKKFTALFNTWKDSGKELKELDEVVLELKDKYQ